MPPKKVKKVASTVKKPLSDEILSETARLLRVLGHPHRLRMIEVLQHQSCTVGELAKATGLAHSACSQHLNLMRAYGILTSERGGKSVYYQVKHPSAIGVIECIKARMGKKQP